MIEIKECVYFNSVLGVCDIDGSVNCPCENYEELIRMSEITKENGMTDKQLLEDIRHELACVDKWYAFEPTSYINTEKEGHTIINNKEFLIQLDFDNLIKRIDKELSE